MLPKSVPTVTVKDTRVQCFLMDIYFIRAQQLLSLSFLGYASYLAVHTLSCRSPIHPFTHIGWNNELFAVALMTFACGFSLWRLTADLARQRVSRLCTIWFYLATSATCTIIYFRYFFFGPGLLAFLASIIALQIAFHEIGHRRFFAISLCCTYFLTLSGLLAAGFILVGR